MSDATNSPSDPAPTAATTKNPNKRVADSHRGDNSWKAYSNQWKENHGTQLMIFAGLVFLAGSGFLYYQQNKFQPPTFPASEAIDSVRTQLIDVDSGGATPASAAALDQTGQFAVLQISGAADDTGQIRVAFYDYQENFNQVEKATWKKAFAPVSEGPIFAEIPLADQSEKFAIAVYHDRNDNGKLDRNKLGIPTERYGFSRGARGKLGPPAFSDALIERPQPGQTIELEIW